MVTDAGDSKDTDDEISNPIEIQNQPGDQYGNRSARNKSDVNKTAISRGVSN